MPRNLNDMVVVITGASAGIGKALAEQLDRHGARLVVSARRIDRLEELNRALGGKHLCVQADVAKREDCETLIAKSIAHFARIDTLVCNAGFGLYIPVADTSPEDVRRLFETNVYGTTDCIHAAVPYMLKQERRDGLRAQIMIVSSAAARRTPPYLGIYGATKAAQLMLAEAMRVELRDSKIAVTSVHPIMTKTEFGQVAESQSQVKIPSGGRAGSQSVEHVARRMVAAIKHHVPEVWPSRPSRWALSFATLVPGMTDRLLRKFRQKVQRQNTPIRP
jgi:short-subunit dehydrogenase